LVSHKSSPANCNLADLVDKVGSEELAQLSVWKLGVASCNFTTSVGEVGEVGEVGSFEGLGRELFYFYLGGVTATAPSRDLTDNKTKRGGRAQAKKKARGSCSRRPRTRERKPGKNKDPSRVHS